MRTGVVEGSYSYRFISKKNDWSALPDDFEWSLSKAVALDDGKEAHGDVPTVISMSDVQLNAVSELGNGVGCLESIAAFHTCGFGPSSISPRSSN